MKPKYRPLYIVMSAAIVLFIIFFERNVGFASFAEEMFINGCMNMVMPGAAYYCEPQKLNNDTVFDELLKTTVPVSAMLPKNNDDYIMLADNSCDYNENNADTDKSGEIMQDTTVSKDAKTDGNTGQNGSTELSRRVKILIIPRRYRQLFQKKILQEQFIAGQSFQIMVLYIIIFI